MMRGHIVKRYNKRYKNNYSIVLDLGTDPATGKRKQQWISFKGTKRDAEKRLSELLHQLDTGTFMKPGKTTLAEFLDRWIEDYRPNLSPRGFDRYDGIVHNHLIPRLGRITLTQLKPEHIQTYYTEALNGGLSAATVQYHHSVLHVALQSALKRGLVNRNVADAVDPGTAIDVMMPAEACHDLPPARRFVGLLQDCSDVSPVLDTLWVLQALVAENKNRSVACVQILTQPGQLMILLI